MEKIKCANCHKHKANLKVPWVGDGGMMGFIHGAYSYWCDCCMFKAQLENAQKQVKRIPMLKKMLKETKCK